MTVTVEIRGGPFQFSAAHSGLHNGQFEPPHGHAGEMAAASPPRHPGVALAAGRACGCQLDWAVRMRTPAGGQRSLSSPLNPMRPALGVPARGRWVREAQHI